MSEGHVSWKFVLIAVSATVLAGALPNQAIAKDDVPKQIKFVIGTGTGGGFDRYGRLTARYMKKHFPGNPSIIVQNMPGAGGIKSLSWLANVAPRDGSAVATMSSSAVFAPLQGLPGATYDATKFNYLISLDRLSNLLIVWNTTPYRSAKDAFEKEIIIANASGPTAIIPIMYNRLLGTKFKVITGYKGTNQVLLALERGEGEGAFNLSWSSITTKPRLLKDRLIRILMQLTFDPIDDARLSGVPTLSEYIKGGIEKDMLEILLAKQEVGRAIIAPQEYVAGTRQNLSRCFNQGRQRSRFPGRRKKKKTHAQDHRG
ncbi:MAG: tripartite tricarboxylate transporter substrate-binding protein [Alphaproteobacteria bacterium]|nr:tripartite tricarboxylate transporter substrate-binding protein [Alphaproteobacteria bacterium]